MASFDQAEKIPFENCSPLNGACFFYNDGFDAGRTKRERERERERKREKNKDPFYIESVANSSLEKNSSAALEKHSCRDA